MFGSFFAFFNSPWLLTIAFFQNVRANRFVVKRGSRVFQLDRNAMDFFNIVHSLTVESLLALGTGAKQVTCWRRFGGWFLSIKAVVSSILD